MPAPPAPMANNDEMHGVTTNKHLQLKIALQTLARLQEHDEAVPQKQAEVLGISLAES